MALYFRKGIWIAVILAVVAGGALYGWVSIGAQARDLAANGVTVTGLITDKTDSTTHRRKGGTRHTYYFDVRFDAGLQGPQTISRGVDREFWDTHFIGSEIPVTYLPADPQVADIKPGATANNARSAGLVGLGCLLGALVTAWVVRRSVRNHANLRTNGIRTQARITFSKTEKGKRRMDFSFTDAQGETIKTTADPAPVAKVGPTPAPGAMIEIIYDPARPKRAVPVDQFSG